MTILKGLLLAGGHGTRLRPLTYTGNKHMLPIANKPMLMYGFDQLRASGISEIGVILGPLQEGIVEALGDGSKFGVKITYIAQPDPKGIAHAVLVSRKWTIFPSWQENSNDLERTRPLFLAG